MDIRHHKSVQAINYFTHKSGGSINRLKVIKLLWLTDRYHIMRHGRIMLMDNYFAMKNGPVASDTYNISKDFTHPYTSDYLAQPGYNNHVIKSSNEVDFDYLSKTEVEAMELVWARFGDISQWDLVDISHEYPEWTPFKDRVELYGSSYKMVHDDFFSVPLNKKAAHYDFFESLEPHIESSKEVLERSRFLSKV